MIISKTPLRMSFVGGGSDLKSFYESGFGAVVSTAIDKYIYVMANRRSDDLIRVSYSRAEYVNVVDELEHNIIREALRLAGITKGIDVVYMGDVLVKGVGTGLGASSTLAVGVLNALYAFQAQPVSAERLAQEACQIEIDVLKAPIGKQDQYAAAYGGLNYIQFNADESVEVKPIGLKAEMIKQLDNDLMMFNTGMVSDSKVVLTEQNSKATNNQRGLEEIVDFAQSLKAILTNNQIYDFGRLLHKNWLYKKTFASTISNSAIDGHYQRALEAGAEGGKVLGSGGGGFLLLYCPGDSKKKAVRNALAELKELPFSFASEGSRIVYRD